MAYVVVEKNLKRIFLLLTGITTTEKQTTLGSTTANIKATIYHLPVTGKYLKSILPCIELLNMWKYTWLLFYSKVIVCRNVLTFFSDYFLN